MNPFQTHPSVRVKGTENNYEPVACVDPNCPKRVPHMHCPFCVQTESYQDPVILKAHYRVKHVDKGIDFAGLKVLRCCDHCDIVGSIKGSKEFKGAHWHCYKCRNGFNRRDEAIKHYRTHFRNPQTTFQIQIAQEVNQPFNVGRAETEQATEAITTSQFTLHPSLAEAAMMTVTAAHETSATSTANTPSNGKEGSDEHHVAVAANETVGTSEGQTMIIIQADETLSNITVADQDTTLSSIDVEAPVVPNDWLQTKLRLERKVKDLTERNAKLEIQHSNEVKTLKTDIDNLRLQLSNQTNALAESQKREEDLLAQINVPHSEKIAQTINQLREQHENLLQQQLNFLKQTVESEPRTVSESEAYDPQGTATPILVISDNAGHHLQGSIVTSEDGRHVFIDSSNSVSHEIMKTDGVGAEAHYEISISKPMEHTHGESVLTSVADNTSLIMTDGTDYQTPGTIQISLPVNHQKRKDTEDSPDEHSDKRTKY